MDLIIEKREMKLSRSGISVPLIACKLAAAFFLTSGQLIFAQNSLPVIRASSTTVDLRDGNHFRKAYWAIMPERKPDYYYVEIPEKPHNITFITDLDSISFSTVYGREYDFIILLNGKDSCFTRISATYKNPVHSSKMQMAAGSDTLPFALGDNSKIYFKGRINGSQLLDIQFDLGAGGTVIKKSSAEKVKMHFDQTVTLHNSDGVNQVPSASTNHLQIENLAWDSVGIAVADNMTHREDLIIGNSLFKDKILEIDYNKMIVLVHDTPPLHSASFSRHELILDGGVIPFAHISLTSRGDTKNGWAMFDTGAYTTILNSADAPLYYRVFGEFMRMVGADQKRFTPKLSIGGFDFSGFNYNVQNMGGDGFHMILGNDLLKRFNIILDNRNGYLYLKANSFVKAPYGRRGEYYLVMIAFGLLIVLASIAVFYISRRKRSSSSF